MRRLVLTLCAALAAPTLAQAAQADEPEAALARRLQGRVAGEPVDCINLGRVRSSRIVRGTAILYEVGGTIYVNRPRSGARSLDPDDTLVTRTHGPRLCRGEVVELYNSPSRIPTGTVFLGDFVPYTRPR